MTDNTQCTKTEATKEISLDLMEQVSEKVQRKLAWIFIVGTNNHPSASSVWAIIRTIIQFFYTICYVAFLY